MEDDSGVAQARELLQELHGQVVTISQKLHCAESARRRTSTRGAMMQHRQASFLRQELHEAHRLINGLHRRFPGALDAEQAVR
ncbi:hypothetical protein [Mycolicibacterium hodleri]|uniref:Transposase n=1 Tax=Mycolicibacterium hodleri TaxID=49897 RepID=A0A502EFJ0_9MYCO|nr:hypothetical protein [Mycolicibacterium hodleri]TPG35752.1 hypothetical protein EAH80_06715 [Mycolicibacterium hodleri]